ncbi:hypothetical protein JXB27_04015 [Candidatus Woesearchaeota archaeon]|nr:hypothetical protein [Candidatus Woesearchaeota archaeon]
MKRGLIFLAVLLSINLSFASITQTPDFEIVKKTGTCFSDGSILFNITRGTNAVLPTNITITIEGDKLDKMKLPGKWQIGNYPLENYEQIDKLRANTWSFKSSPVLAEGTYAIKLEWESRQDYASGTSFAVNCPARKCISNDDCTSQQKCTDGACVWLECPEGTYAMGHACLGICEDYDECTNDYFIDGECIHTENDKCKEQEPVEKKLSILQKIWNWLTGKN